MVSEQGVDVNVSSQDYLLSGGCDCSEFVKQGIGNYVSRSPVEGDYAHASTFGVEVEGAHFEIRT